MDADKDRSDDAVTAKPVVVTAAAKRRVRNSKARRENTERLNRALGLKCCIHCGTTGAWDITKTEGDLHYLDCLGCHQPGKIVVRKVKP